MNQVNSKLHVMVEIIRKTEGRGKMPEHEWTQLEQRFGRSRHQDKFGINK